MQTIDIRNNNLIPDEYMLLTKAGKRWRPNWSKMVADKINIIAHSNVYTLTDRFKKEGKYYLVFTDGTNNYIERQDKAKRNKKLAKDTVIEAVKRVIAGLLPAPKEPIDLLLKQAKLWKNEFNNSLKNNPANYTKKGVLKKRIEQQLITEEPPTIEIGDVIFGNVLVEDIDIFTAKFAFIAAVTDAMGISNDIRRYLIHSYHPDTNPYFGNTDKLQVVANLW